MNRIAALLLAAFACTTALPAGAAGTHIDWKLTPDRIKTTCATAIARAQGSVRTLLAQRGRRTFSSTVLPLENLYADLNDGTVAQTFLYEVAVDKPVRDAAMNCNNDELAFQTALKASPQIYAALAAAKRSGTAANVYQRKTTDMWIDVFKRSGAGLSQARRLEFVKLSNQLNTIQNKYLQNLDEDETTITITPAQAASLPNDFVAGLKKSGSGYAVPVNESTLVTFYENQSDESARRAYYFAYNNRQAAVNTQLIESAIALRDRLAHLLGYQTWAAYQLSDRMAKSPDRVMKFLDALDARVLPAAKADVERLREIKAKETRNPNAVLERWDITYYDNQLRKTQYAVDQNEIRQYFPVAHTIDAVLAIYHTLLGVDFRQVTPADAWAPDVMEYTVSDSASGKLIGTTYFDLFPRPGKYDHFANFALLPARMNADGSYRPPVAAIVGNWPKPVPGHPALLSHDDVVTFFHEFGHDMAALLGTAPYETLSNGFVWDFVEAPSQMLENFVWQPAVLKQISSNWKTGAPLPDNLIDALVRSRYVDDGYDTTGDVFYSAVDLAYHTSGPHVDTTAVWQTMQARLMPLAPVQGIHPQAGFGHLMGGYDAGYYGYLWSKVYAQDLFTAFLQGGLENPAVGMRYRKDILEPAQTYDPDVEVERFLGRPMSPDAFYQEFETVPSPAPQGSSSP